MARSWASCRCFYERHIYLKQVNAHVEFSSEAQYVDFSNEEKFLQDYSEILQDANQQEILTEVKQEVERRKNRFLVIDKNRKYISTNYHPLHQQLFEDKTMKLESFEPKKVFEGVYSSPVFDTNLCDKIVEELDNFKRSEMTHSKPNSMNKHGVILQELGLDNIVEILKTHVEPFAKDFFPDLVGETGLDSNKSFTVEYDASEDRFDKDLATHFDNAEVTLNISLTDEHEEGELYFLKDEKVLPVQHKKGHGILHSGRDLHGAMPVTDGRRTNLILWFRSSSVRNQECPMCGQEPMLEPVQCGTGDGFTV
eukprot:GFUD01008766.1.p1 GENE.GFUD01008766.1~~GFUD01008766.1.p1  ORF type:complete len:336 (-),score=72.15 GFUD01008766.1:111-1040(-)